LTRAPTPKHDEGIAAEHDPYWTPWSWSLDGKSDAFQSLTSDTVSALVELAVARADAQRVALFYDVDGPPDFLTSTTVTETSGCFYHREIEMPAQPLNADSGATEGYRRLGDGVLASTGRRPGHVILLHF
jgi:hypothetical protein